MSCDNYTMSFCTRLILLTDTNLLSEDLIISCITYQAIVFFCQKTFLYVKPHASYVREKKDQSM